MKVITLAKKGHTKLQPNEGKLRWERIKEKERTPGYAKMRILEGALRNLQNSADPPSLTRAERIQE